MTARIGTSVAIRPATPGDYPALARVSNAVFSDYATSPDELRRDDEQRDPKCHLARFVAERDGAVVGLAECVQFAGMYHPRKFVLGVTVHPDWQGRGIGAALYDCALASLAPFDPLSVRGQTRSDWPRALRFLADRGFVEGMRSWESRLDVAAFDPAPFADAEARAAAAGVVIRTIAELAGDPDRDRRLYDLNVELSADVPSPEPHTPITYEHFVRRVIEDPNLLPDAYFVAVDAATGEYAGMSQLWNSEGSADLYNGLTAVRRPYRRRGLALALKLRGIAYAQAQGRPQIKTWNESNNRGMLAINEALGFVKQPAWIDFVKQLRDED